MNGKIGMVGMVLAFAVGVQASMVTLDLTKAGTSETAAGLNQTFWDDFDLGNGWTADITVTTAGGSGLNTIAVGYGVAGGAEANRMGPGDTMTFTFSDLSAGITALNFVGFISENDTGAWAMGSATANNAAADTMLINGTPFVAGAFTDTAPALSFSPDGHPGYVYQTLDTAVAANASDAFEIGMSAGTVRLQGLQFEAIPEPATLGMVAAFGGSILFIRRRLVM